MAASVGRTMTEVSTDIRFMQSESMAGRVDELLEPWKLGATMFVVFGLLALLVAGVGLYSILAFAVAERRRELGIRSALGAQRRGFIAIVVRQAGAYVLAGLAGGVLVALLAGRFVETMLFGVRATDPFAYVGVVAILALACVAASLVPAWRATAVNPTTALRAE